MLDGSLIGRVASMAKAVNDSKAAQRQLEELQLHDETGPRTVLAPYKYGRRLISARKRR